MMKKTDFFWILLVELLTSWYNGLFGIRAILVSRFVAVLYAIAGILLVILHFLHPVEMHDALWIIGIVYVTGCVFTALRISFFSKKQDDGDSSLCHKSSDTLAGFFDGMDKDEATKEYRRLLKYYHPDNLETGNEEMAEAIIREYHVIYK